MRRNRILALSATAFALATLLAAPSARAGETVRTLDETIPAAGRATVGFHGTVGEVTVVGVSGSAVKAEIQIRCERERDEACRRAAEEVDLRVRRRGDRIQLDIEDWPKLHNKRISFHGRIEVPRDLAVEIDMGVGEIHVEGTAGDLEVDLGVGEIDIEMDGAAVRSIELDTGVGEATLTTGERTIDGTGFVGSHLTWRNGPGNARVEVDTGVGEIEVRLR